MGAAMARALFHVERPTVGLLNIGVEEIKGIEEVQAGARLLKETGLPIDYRGFVEGRPDRPGYRRCRRRRRLRRQHCAEDRRGNGPADWPTSRMR